MKNHNYFNIFRNVVIIITIMTASCATPPGQIIGDSVCDCLSKTGGERPKIKLCMEQFQKDVKSELARQNLSEAASNEEAARAMSIMRLCMRKVSGWDTLRPMPPMHQTVPTIPQETPVVDSAR